ncbi:MAG: SH3 domain-containing protein [Clostridia bacterium]|nr:SH3 domain-containing protein [Clostridia bacterium]
MINRDAFLEQVQVIFGEAPTYRLGGDGSDGTCDCIGLVIGAIRRAGGEWDGTHGSNFAARERVTQMRKQVAAEDLQLGWLVFKARGPRDAGYALPGSYRAGEDLMDYYHVGVVTGVEPLTITHCTSSGSVNGVTVDHAQGKWLYAGPCALVRYGEGEKRQVTASSGGTVNLRKAPEGALLCRIPLGETVEVLSRQDGWARVLWGNRYGFMQERFLEQTGEAGNLLEELKALIAKYEGRAT